MTRLAALALALLLALAPPAPAGDREAALRRAEAVAAAAGVPCVRAGFRSDWIARVPDSGARIELNAASPFWDDADATTAGEYKAGFWSAGVPDQLIRHEVGHVRHARAVGPLAMWWHRNTSFTDAEAGRVAAAVGTYASRNPTEFVAEVYAGTVAGRVFPADVMALYRRFGGPAVGSR